MSAAAGRDLWDRAWVGWDVAFGTALAVAVAGALAQLDGVRQVRVVALLLALGGWYAAAGARALRTGSVRLGLLYLAGMAPLFLVAFAQYGTVGLMFFVLYPQVWVLTGSRPGAIAATALLTAGGALASLVALDNSPLEVVAQTAVQLGFATAMGLWVSGIMEQSVSRRAVIAELQATRAELAAVSHRAGALAERERLAREIHDTLAQGFTSVVMLLELAESEMDTDPAAARRRLATARDTARRNLIEAQALVAALTPVDLQAAPLPEALGRLLERHGRETGQPATFAVTGEPRPLPANSEVVLLRAAQEALANVRKHAGSCRVAVDLRYGPGGTSLAITDEGTGFDPGAATAGYGLAGMRRRVAEVGGALTIRSGPGGTTVEVAVG